MSTLIALFLLFALGGIAVVSLLVLVAAAKFTAHLVLLPFKIVLLPFKLLLLPFVLVALVVKLAVLIAVISVVVALLLPLAIIVGLIVAPFALASAVLS